MDADSRGYLDSVTERVLGAVFEVANTLGIGFLERVYERALVRELRLGGLRVVEQARFGVLYKGALVGEYLADLLVEDAVVVELKCVDRLTDDHLAQGLNYLKVSGKKVCLLVNFGRKRVEWKRVVLGVEEEKAKLAADARG